MGNDKNKTLLAVAKKLSVCLDTLTRKLTSGSVEDGQVCI